MTLNSNRERKRWWDETLKEKGEAAMLQAIATLKPETQTVIHLHYLENVPLKDIAPILQRTMTIVRNHQIRGIFELQHYFNQS